MQQNISTQNNEAELLAMRHSGRMVDIELPKKGKYLSHYSLLSRCIQNIQQPGKLDMFLGHIKTLSLEELCVCLELENEWGWTLLLDAVSAEAKKESNRLVAPLIGPLVILAKGDVNVRTCLRKVLAASAMLEQQSLAEAEEVGWVPCCPCLKNLLSWLLMKEKRQNSTTEHKNYTPCQLAHYYYGKDGATTRYLKTIEQELKDIKDN
jgi:hypothetical protein